VHLLAEAEENSFKGECEQKVLAISFAGLFIYTALKKEIKMPPKNQGHDLKTKPV
jgi:hypothetical protein